MPFIRFTVFVLLSVSVAVPQTAPTPEARAIFQTAKAATVIVLTGEGAGRLKSISTGVIITKNGVLLTALHAVKGAAEVQVRTADGEVYDHVEILGSDDRRDVAALKISAGNLEPLRPGRSKDLAQGDPVYAVTNANGLAWSATEGIYSALRSADEVGAGSGFHLIQFTALVAPGSSGGALLDRTGALVGIITRGNEGSGFAVPIENILGLADSGHAVALGSGSDLQLPAKSNEVPQSSATIANADPKRLLKDARTILIHSKTAFLTVDTLDRALLREKNWPGLALTIVQDRRVADVIIEIDRPLFTYVHTFVITDKKTSIVLGSGKVTAFDGTTASGRLAKEITEILAQARNPTSPKKKI